MTYADEIWVTPPRTSAPVRAPRDAEPGHGRTIDAWN